LPLLIQVETNQVEANQVEGNRVEANRVEANQVTANPVKIARIGTAYLYKPRWQKQFRQTARGADASSA
jgi:hypothetical protein